LITLCGFTFHQDPEVKKHYRILAKTHFHGQCGDLQFKTNIYTTGMVFEFYQDIVHKNPHGGYYDFHKVEKMPYLIRLKLTWIMQKIIVLLEERGFVNKTKPVFRTAYANIFQHRAELEAFQGKGFYDRELPSYNCTDADGNRLEDGMIRYFRDYNGYLVRGTIYHNINNMWWVDVNKDCYSNQADFKLFQLNDSVKRGRFIEPRRRRQKIESLLSMAIQNQNFEKAIVYRDLLKEITDEAA
jgi:hypothetical protein